jgi:hypothetical protein
LVTDPVKAELDRVAPAAYAGYRQPMLPLAASRRLGPSMRRTSAANPLDDDLLAAVTLRSIILARRFGRGVLAPQRR